MGFGIELGKTVAKTGTNMLTGGLVNGIMGLFGGGNKAEQRQYQHEKEMMALQNKYNTQAAAQSMEYAKTMNRINFEQQNQMFEKQAEWNSAEQQKQRLKEAGSRCRLCVDRLFCQHTSKPSKSFIRITERVLWFVNQQYTLKGNPNVLHSTLP